MNPLQILQIILIIISVFTGIKAYRQAQKLQKRGQEILATKNADGGKIPVIYGARRVGSTLIYMDTDSGNSKELFVVYGLSVGEIESIDLETIEINGVSIKDSKVFRQGYYAGYDSIASGAGSLCTASQIGNVQESNAGGSGTDPTKRYRMVFNAHLGADDQVADPMLVASIPKWTSAHRLRGIAYIAASFEYDSRGMFSSVPELTVVARGKKLYDPRKDGSISGGSGSHRIDDSSTFEWSDNAALALLDYISNDEYGKGLSASLINLQSFQTAANTAETLVDVPEFGGSYSSATFSGTTGNNYIDIDSDSWEAIKGGAYISLRDSADDNELTEVRATESQRYTPHTESTVYRTHITQSLQNSYSNEAGSLLVQTKRFHCNGLVDTNDNVLENTRDLLSNIRGFLNFVDGKYTVLIEDTASSAFSVTDDHIIDDQGIKISYEDKSTKYNKVVVSFFNAQKKYEADTVTVYHNASPNYKSDDGGEELEIKVEFDYITNPYIAYNIGKAILGRSRNQKTLSFLATPELYQLTVGDVIDITYAGLGLSGHLFRIEAIDLLDNGLLNIQAIEYLDIYTWDSVPPIENVGALPDLPTGLESIPPTNLTFTDSNSSATGRPFLSWTAATNYPAKEFRVVIVDSSSNELHNRIVSNESIDLNFIPVGSNYVASVSSINSVGSESDPATLTFSVATAPVTTVDIDDDAITLDKIGSDVQSAIDAGGVNSTQLIKSTSAPTQRSDGSSLQQQDLWADTDDNNQVYIRNAANNGWEKARDSSLITLYNSLSSTVSTNSTNISTAQSDIVTLTTDTAANSTAITNLQSSLTTTNSNVSTNASNITSLQTQVTANDGDISSLSSSVTSLQSDLTSAESDISANASNITSLQTQVTSNDGDISSLSSSLTSLTSTVNSNTAAISSEATTRANADSALSTSITNLTSTVNGNTSSISTNASAIADIEGNAAASYVLQLNANGKVAQMVLESNADAGTGATSTIAFLADTFKIDNDAGSSVSPFVVTGGTVYIDNARITDLSADKIRIDNVTLDTDGSGNLIIKTEGVNTTQIADRATSVFATATGGIGYWYVDNLAQTAIVTTGVFQAPSATGNTFFVIGNTYINANSGGSTADWCELQVQRRSASTSGGVSSAAYSTIATIRARGETGEALQSIIANDAYTADYYYQYRVTLQTNGTGTLYSTRSYGISGIQVIVNYK